jgi:uncharacterized membrane protein YkgB
MPFCCFTRYFVRILVVLSILVSTTNTVKAVDEGQRFIDGAGVYVYKSVLPFAEHIGGTNGFIELYAGAHYYV